MPDDGLSSDATSTVWWHQWRLMAVRIDGNLAATPTITRINTNVPSAGFLIVDDQGDICCGTTATAGSNTLTRLS